MRVTAERVGLVSPAEQAIEAWTRINRVEIVERANATLSAMPRPFVRWAGSKQRLLSQLVEHLPSGYRRYYEPFFGAGSLYFLLRPERARVNDTCGPLIEMYRTVSEKVDEVQTLLNDMDVLDRDLYYKIRSASPRTEVERAARFIYLNRAGWNGLYRVNSKGEFNVPYGMPRSAKIIDVENFKAAAAQLSHQGTEITDVDFEAAVAKAGTGDLVFFDPPYASSKRREGFVDYNERLFTWEDQRRLASCAERLRLAGAKVIVTNSYNSAVQELYPNFSEHALVRRSSLASDMKRRGSVAESVFVS